MIEPSTHWTGPKEVSQVLLSTTDADAYALSAQIRRSLPRGAGWTVRTLKRYVRAENVTAAVWVVVVSQGSEQPTHAKERLEPSQCDPRNDPSGDLEP